MAYIGKQPVVGNFQVCDAISVVNGQAAYTMQVGSTNVEPENANHMLVSLNGVLQKPGSSFTISGSTITFASNLATGDVIDFIILLGDTLNVGTPSDDSVGAAQIKNDLISGTTALTSAPDDTDEFLVSDAGTLKRIDYSLIKSGGLVLLNQASSSTDVTNLDIDSTYINSTYDNYLIKLNLVPATNAVNLYGRFFVGGTVQTGSNYAFANYSLDSNSGAAGGQNASNSQSYFSLISVDTVGNSSTDTFQSVLELANVNSTTFQTSLHSSSHFMNADSTAVPYSLKGVAHYLTNSSVINGIRFYFSSGDISEYEYKIYGITK